MRRFVRVMAVSVAVMPLAVQAPGQAAATQDDRVIGGSATMVGDLNGDGKADVFSKHPDHSWWVSYGATTAWQVVNNGSFDPGSAWLADMNGDGADDLFTVLPDGRWMVSYNATTPWEVINGGTINPTRTRLGDLDGDGKDDVVFFNEGGNWLVSYGGRTAWQVINNGGFDLSRMSLADISGDGKEDVFANINGSWAVSYGGVTGWQGINNGDFDPSATWLADINGDGKDDVFSVLWGTQWAVSYGASSGWQVVNNGTFDPARTWLADIDGDGKADVFSVLPDHQWIVSYGATAGWQTINNGALPGTLPDPETSPSPAAESFTVEAEVGDTPKVNSTQGSVNGRATVGTGSYTCVKRTTASSALRAHTPLKVDVDDDSWDSHWVTHVYSLPSARLVSGSWTTQLQLCSIGGARNKTWRRMRHAGINVAINNANNMRMAEKWGTGVDNGTVSASLGFEVGIAKATTISGSLPVTDGGHFKGNIGDSTKCGSIGRASGNQVNAYWDFTYPGYGTGDFKGNVLQVLYEFPVADKRNFDIIVQDCRQRRY
jgi:hypothetical protein